MEKVVVPKFVADWYEGFRYKSLRLVLNHLMSCEDQRIMEWVDKNSPRSAQEIIAKMHLFQDYKVEEENKCYWRKKREYLLDCEIEDYTYLNIEKDTGVIYFSDKGNFSIHQTILTETQVKQAVGEEDFKKLEMVEID